jgi:hypothetical protein
VSVRLFVPEQRFNQFVDFYETQGGHDIEGDLNAILFF